MRSALLAAIVALLAACGDGATAPSSEATTTPGGSVALAQKVTISCSVTTVTGGWSISLQWKGVPVRNVTIQLEEGRITTPLDHLTRKGSLTTPTTDAPLGFILDDGTTTVASGGCAAP